jgi:hypothetical protein
MAVRTIGRARRVRMGISARVVSSLWLTSDPGGLYNFKYDARKRHGIVFYERKAFWEGYRMTYLKFRDVRESQRLSPDNPQLP